MIEGAPVVSVEVKISAAIRLDFGEFSMDFGASKLVLDREWFVELIQRCFVVVWLKQAIRA